jgi:hypothetical protein
VMTMANRSTRLLRRRPYLDEPPPRPEPAGGYLDPSDAR